MIITDHEKLSLISEMIREKKTQRDISRIAQVSVVRLKETAKAKGWDIQYMIKHKSDVTAPMSKPLNDKTPKAGYPRDRLCINRECKKVFRSHGAGNQHCAQCVRYINSSAYS